MTLDGLLTFLGLAVAVYAVLPPIGRLRIQLQMGPQLTLAALTLALVFYLEFFEFVSLPCPGAIEPICRWMVFHSGTRFTPDKVAFLVVFGWMFVAVAIFRWLPASARALGPMASLIDQLLYQERFGEAVDFLQPHLALIEKAINGKLPFQRYAEWAQGTESFDPERWLLAGKATVMPDQRFRKAKAWVLRPTLFLLPSPGRAADSASRIVHMIYFSKELLNYLARQRTSFAGELIKLDVREQFYFSDEFLRCLISQPGSRLYEEIKRNLQHGAHGSYEVDNRNPILQIYFSDARLAVDLLAWKPVGDFALESIKTTDTKRLAFLNGSRENFEVEQWDEPVYVAIQYFTIMVSSAASQSVVDDMWLSYLTLFFEALLEIYDEDAIGADQGQEFPNRAAELMHETVSVMCDWVGIFHQLKPKSPHRKLPEAMSRGTSSIPTSAARNLGRMAEALVMSRRMGRPFASSLLEQMLGAVKRLVHGDEEKKFRALVIEALIYPNGHAADERYGRRLAGLVRSVDSHLLYSLQDFTQALKKAFPGVDLRAAEWTSEED